VSVCSSLAAAESAVKPIGRGLYAYISDNDASANSTFLVGDAGILVVDTGLNRTEGSKLLGAIRRVSGLRDPASLRLARELHCEYTLSS